jgi:hypothetical protein
MTTNTAEPSLRFKARMTGILSLLTILTGIFAQAFVSDRLVVNSDASATATNILAHRGLFEASFMVFMIEMACQTAMTALFYYLLKPAGRSLALIAAFLGLSGSVIKTLSRLFYIAPLLVLSGAPYLNVFRPDQLQALALLLLKLNGRGTSIAMVFLGFYAVLNGYLMIRSTFLPATLGAVSVVAGAGWLTFLYPPLGSRLFLYVVLFAIPGAAALIVWLFVFGVNEQRWKEQAHASVE